jgi:hypothetical protein
VNHFLLRKDGIYRGPSPLRGLFTEARRETVRKASGASVA